MRTASVKSTLSALLAQLSLIGLVACGGLRSPGGPVGPPVQVHNQWTWESGSNSFDQYGSYVSHGPSPANAPGSRCYSVSWTDKSGNLWLFGGVGIDGSGIRQDVEMNDMWEYTGGQWSWVSGSNVGEQQGVYGTQGIAAPSNTPGARFQAMSWTDPAGTFWLSGGVGPDVNGRRGRLNDLWTFSGGEWTWVGGSQTTAENVPGSYGIKGVSSGTTLPGARVDASTWADPSGSLWLFGGFGYDSTGTLGLLNDLWRYNAGQWTWISGSNLISQTGTYGIKGVAAVGNVPGARYNPVSWVDAAGALWMFGGGTYEPNTQPGCGFAGPCIANDLWRFAGGEWTWMGGSATENNSGMFGTQGVASGSNMPGARVSALAWIDTHDNVWLFGGYGPGGLHNDLWKYSSGQWTWVGGSMFGDQPGLYGEKGTTAESNQPPSREAAVNWIDASGNLWLFGGESLSSRGLTKPNDLWMYQP